MKKIVLMVSGIAILAVMTIGCSRGNTETERALIDRANALIEEKYDVEINKDDYSYDLGKAVNDDQFESIKDGEIPNEVFLRAVNKDKPSTGKVFDYSIKFNTETDEILSSECGIIK